MIMVERARKGGLRKKASGSTNSQRRQGTNAKILSETW